MALKAVAVRVNDKSAVSLRVSGSVLNNTITELLDVSVTNIQEDDVLMYNNELSKFINTKINLDFGEY